jgi:NADPH-dependent glutamate synthase beta subunit-like oxidoreductase
VVDREIQRIVDLGVDVHTDTAVDGPEAFDRLRQEYDAVFIAVGAQRAKRLGHLDEAGGATRVLDGLDYLRQVSDGEDLALGERVVVIGGGSAAIDVARTARRQGKQVTVMSLETRDVMPAQREEVSEAVEEGVRLVDGAMASGATLAVECLTLECRLVTLDPEAPPGVLRPLPIEGSDFVLEADAVIMAIGQDADLAAFGQALQTEQAVLEVDRDTLATSLEGVFAGGDVATMSRYVSVAVAEGRRAAWGIAAYLEHPDAQPLPHLDLSQAVAATEVNVFYFPPSQRTEKERTPVERRLDDFREVALAYTPAQAASEAGRCMSCGLCIECDNCFVFCPDMAIKKDDLLDEHYAVLEQYCKGCGLCVVECPRGAVHLEQVTR